MTEEDDKLLKCLLRRYEAGAKTLVLNREEARRVIFLLEKKETLDRASAMALKILQQNER